MKIPFFRSEDNGGKESSNRHSLLRNNDPIFAEQHKNFSSRVEYCIDVKRAKVIAVTSTIAGEGKTVSTVNLAINLAATGRKKVLLVDVDLRKSDLAKGLRFPSSPGLSELLSGAAGMKDVLRQVLSQRFHVIPSGRRIDAPWELLTGDRFRNLLTELRQAYDVVLLDTPPVLPVSDTMSFRELMDGFILVYRLGYTPHDLFRETLEDIGEAQLLGVLLNGVQPHSERYYQKYYGKYYIKREASNGG